MGIAADGQKFKFYEGAVSRHCGRTGIQKLLGRDQSKNLLVLDKKYQDNFDVYLDMGIKGSKGSGPARNFAWEHSMSEGHPWHWIMDDNIDMFFRLNKNLRVPVADGTMFRCMEDFCLRYKNVAMAGPNYLGPFVARKAKRPPFITNTRICSCNLIRNDTGFRWRGRYNEDMDLSVRMLKAGWCTILFQAFLQRKATTLTMKGGNTDSIYKNGTFDKSKMLVYMHPDVTRLAWRRRRWHHFVDYTPFRENKLIRRDDVVLKHTTDNFGMELLVDQPSIHKDISALYR
jgi:TET-Associated Glycosyltransferase